MADLFSVTAPLAIRYRDSGEKQVMVARLPYNGGLLYLPTFWTDRPIEQSLRYVPGPVEGEGPWKVGTQGIVTVLACHGTDAELANDFSCWQNRLMEPGMDYPDDDTLLLLMKTHAAGVAGTGDATADPVFQRDE